MSDADFYEWRVNNMSLAFMGIGQDTFNPSAARMRGLLSHPFSRGFGIAVIEHAVNFIKGGKVNISSIPSAMEFYKKLGFRNEHANPFEMFLDVNLLKTQWVLDDNQQWNIKHLIGNAPPPPLGIYSTDLETLMAAYKTCRIKGELEFPDQVPIDDEMPV